MTISNPAVVREARATLVIVGTRRSTVTVRFGSGLVGVTSALPLLRVTTSLRAPATVPVENATSGLPLKSPFVVFGGTVKFTLYAEKEPSKPETIVINPSILQQISADFAAYRTADR